MTTKGWSAAALALVLCVACKSENTSGLPETDTTGTAQSAQDTSSATATTTGQTGGTSSALSPEDKEFISKAGMGGLFEVQAANVALAEELAAIEANDLQLRLLALVEEARPAEEAQPAQPSGAAPNAPRPPDATVPSALARPAPARTPNRESRVTRPSPGAYIASVASRRETRRPVEVR